MTILIFLMLVAGALTIDLGLLNRRAHAPSVGEAVAWSAAWVALSVVFGGWVWATEGSDYGTRWFTAYIMEKALSVDNLFVFSLIFAYFKIDGKYQHKVLVWGVFGVVLLRIFLIAGGVNLVQSFHWLLYGFGAFLCYAGFKMFRGEEDEEDDIENSWAVKIAKFLVPYWGGDHQGKFLLPSQRMGSTNWGYLATRLLLCLVTIEIADVMFAVDSIPVVVSITRDVTLAFTSNVMAVLGLRSMFFLLQHLLDRLRFLPYALGAILMFIGAKMLLEDFITITTVQSLGVVFGLLTAAVLASTFTKKED